jgi:PAS domain S-box-containing protein
MIQPAFLLPRSTVRICSVSRHRGWSDYAALRVVCLALALAAPATAAAQEQLPLSTAAAARNMASWTPSPATVRVRGVVTIHDRSRNLTFLQDATAGLFLMPTAPVPDLVAGQLIEATGRVVMTRRGPAITGAFVEVVGTAAAPPAEPLSAWANRLASLDARLVTMRGVVRRIETGGAGTEITLRTPEAAITILQPGGAGGDAPVVDAVVTAQGVLSNALAEDRSLARRELLAPSLQSVRVESRPPADPYAIAEVPVQDLRRPPGSGDIVRRVKVSGIVTRQRPGRSLYLRTATGAIHIETNLTAGVVPGDRVEAVGFPDAGEYSMILADAIFRRVESGPRPEPMPATPADLLEGRHEAELVRIEGTFVEGEQERDAYTLVLQDSDVFFNVQLVSARAASLPSGLRPGMRVQVTGVCQVVVDADRVPRSFRVLMRDADDITVLGPSRSIAPGSSGAPIWAWAGVIVALVALGGAGWVYRRGQSMERTIQRQMARESALKARFDDLFERTTEILIVHDRRGRVSTINRAGEQATGYSREELRMLDPSWIFGADYIDAVTGMIDEGSEGTPRTFKSELVARKGGRIPIDVHSRVLTGDGQVVGVTSIARDASERERLENELRQAQKMEAVGRLATGIAHDFNNLITVLLGYSDELIEEVPKGSDQERSAREIRRAAERASGLTQQLLAFSRRQTAVAQTIDLNVVVTTMENLVRRLIGPEIRLELSLASGLSKIRADAAQIGQVMMNLAVNARDAMPNGGTLQVETANVELGADNIDVIPGPHVMLAVRDSGVGMSEDVRKRLFEPFFTTKGTGEGTGLGLSMVNAIVRQGGGHIIVDSAPGRGSVFRVYFPVQDQAAQAPAPPLTPLNLVAVRGEGVILLAEDDLSVRRLVSMELTRRGFTVIDAEDGRAALDLLAQNKDRVDVLVTDIVMPRMNGADLAKAAEKIRPGLKILFISGHPERAGAGLNPAGVTNLLMKPFTADILATRIKELMSG